MVKLKPRTLAFGFCLFLALCACKPGNGKPDLVSIDKLNLKRGEIVSCGSPDEEFGTVDFSVNCGDELKGEFNTAVELLHSFEYDESEKVFARIIDKSPGCVMAYWGVAMCNFHLLWEPPSEAELKKGASAIQIARAIRGESEKEMDYVNAVAAYYNDWQSTAHPARSVNFEKAMEQLHDKYPTDKEASIIYALSLIGAANPTDRTYAKQKRAGEILGELYKTQPNHPGIIHYIIHAYDYPGIAELGLPAAQRYAEVAPSSAHALHMPSHIFTRLGLWDDCIKSNSESVDAAKCYAEAAGIVGHWDEELHGIDYIVYGHLQKAENKLAQQQCEYLKTITQVYPINFKDAYAFAAIPARYVLENRLWKEAANLPVHPSSFPWERFPWQTAIFHFTRLLGSVHTDDIVAAKLELATLEKSRDDLIKEKDLYKANQLTIQIKAGKAWIEWKSGHGKEAIQLMTEAADLEDATAKHPVTPGSIIPARELLGDLLIQMTKPSDALVAYEADLKLQPNRFNGLYGAAIASQKTGDIKKATEYLQRLVSLANSENASRRELDEARLFLITHQPR